MNTAVATALNARIPETLRRRLDIAVAQRGVTIQQAVAEAIELWIEGAPQKQLQEAPVISARGGSLRITKEEIDAAILG